MVKILETDRITIEEASSNDAPFFYDLLNSPGWIQFIGDRGIKNLQDAENYIQNSLIKGYKLHGYGLYKIELKESGTPVGICGLLKRPYLEHPDIGFAIMPQFEGKGYCFEAAKGVMNYAFTKLNQTTLLGITTLENVKSQNLLRKLGLKHIDTLPATTLDPEFMLFST